MSLRLTDDGYCCSLDVAALDSDVENRFATKFSNKNSTLFII